MLARWLDGVRPLAACIAGLLLSPAVLAAPVRIVAAESVYGDIARQVVGPGAAVSSILTNPAADPHEFEAPPSAARALSGAQIVIVNGAGYDAWIDRLMPRSAAIIDVAALLHRKPGDNPHLWYDEAAAPALCAALVKALGGGTAPVPESRTHLLGDLATLHARIARLRGRFAGVPAAATEPVFGLTLQAIGLTDRHARFELAVMNGTEPRASDIAALQDDLRGHRVRLLVTDVQASSPATGRLLGIARTAGIPVVTVTETLPPGLDYQSWFGAALDRLQAALETAAAAAP